MSSDSDIEVGLLPIYLLLRASKEPISSTTAIVQLELHGISSDDSSVSRTLRRLEAKGYIVSRAEKNRTSVLKTYRITRRGRAELRKARVHIRELFRESEMTIAAICT